MLFLLAQDAPATGETPAAQPAAESQAPGEAQTTGGTEAPPAPPQPAPSMCGDPMLPFLLLGVWGIFYLLVFRPQRKQEKERQARLAAIQKGDLVRTRGGVVAPVVRVKDDTIVLQLEGDGRAEMVVAKAYVDEVYGKDGDGKKASGK